MLFYACKVTDKNRLEACINLASQLRVDIFSFSVVQLLNANARPDAYKLKIDPELKSFIDVWSQLALKDALLKQCNERAIFPRIFDPPCLTKNVPCAALACALRLKNDAAPLGTTLLIITCLR